MEALEERTLLLTGTEGMEKLRSARVVLFGVGGVGSFAAEALARAGIGWIRLVDYDRVNASNLNRQLVALHSTLGLPKVEVMRQRILDINPRCRVEAIMDYFRLEHLVLEDGGSPDFVVDAIDMVTAKLEMLTEAHHRGIPVISSMGAGNRLDNTGFRIADISRTQTCPLARVMRRELKNRGITRGIPVVYSEVPADTSRKPMEEGRPVIGSISYVPGTAGLYLAGYVIRELINR